MLPALRLGFANDILSRWDKTASKYKTVESAAPPEEVTELDEYVFVVRVRIGQSMRIYEV